MPTSWRIVRQHATKRMIRSVRIDTVTDNEQEGAIPSWRLEEWNKTHEYIRKRIKREWNKDFRVGEQNNAPSNTPIGREHETVRKKRQDFMEAN